MSPPASVGAKGLSAVAAKYLMILLTAGPGPVGPSPAWDSVANQVVARQNALERLFFAGYMTTTVPEGTQTDRLATAFAPGRCLLDFMHRTGRDQRPWQDDARFRLWLTPGGSNVFRPFTRAFYPEVTQEENAFYQRYWTSPYAQVIGWHPKAAVFDKPDPEFPYLDDLFSPEQRADLVFRPETEEIDSLTCVVFACKRRPDRLWLAPQLGFAVVKREMHAGPRGELRTTHRCRKFKETAKGLWLPWEIEVERVEIADGAEKLVRRFRIDVEQLAVNGGVPDALFEFKPPPGTLTYDVKEKVIGFEPGGEDLLDLWGAVCADVFPPDPPQRPPTWQFVLSAATCLVGLVAGIAALWRAVRTGSRAGPGLASADS